MGRAIFPPLKGIAACVNFIPPPADLRLFVHGLRSERADLGLLDAARTKADEDPAILRMLAGIWFYYDPLKEKEAPARP